MHANLSAATEPPEQRAARLPYLPGLDGLRALAVVAVLLYHADLNISGGFLGVESFFALSGFLITALLLAEWHQHGRIDFRGFWLRRARRLLPALFLMLVGTLTFARLLLPGETTEVHADLLAALGYVMNWHLVFSQQSYFDSTVRPSLLQNLWSLAVEEQFYLLWPLLFSAGMRSLRSSGFLRATLATAAASVALMAMLYQPGADPSRIYYGTDTRAAGLLLGAALALVWTPGRTPAATSRGVGRLLDIAGTLALVGLIASFVWVYEYHPLLYRGGFAVVALGTAIVIAATTHPRARLMPGVLGWRPLRWIGLRSYGIYLWHWPVFMVTRPYLDVPFDGWPLLVLRLAIVGALVELSYRFVELPVRHGAIEQAWRAIWTRRREPPSRQASRPPRLHRLHLPIVGILIASTTACALQIEPQPAAAPSSTAATRPSLSAPSPAATDTITAISLAAATPTTATAASPVATPTTAATALLAATSPTAMAEAPTFTGSTAEPAPTVVALEPFDPALAAELQRILDQTVADGYIPGAVLAVNIPGLQTWIGASGIADRQTAQPMEPTTQVRIASISKMFTAVVMLQLVEEGKIDLDAPIATWLPKLVPQGDTISVRNLLNHTTGLYDYLEDRKFVNQAYRTPNRIWAPSELVAYATQFPPSFRPGAKGAWDYSSTNYVILGMIVEQVTGNTLAHEMRQRIFDPLGLEHTFSPPEEKIQGVQAHGYSNTVDQTNASMTFVFATANIVSSADDVQRFAQALFNGQLLKTDTLTMMQHFVNGKGQYKMPKLEYGLGVMRNQLPVGPGPDSRPHPAAASTVLGHIGGYGGFRSAVWFAPESGITIALGVNQAATDPNTLATKVFDAILTHQRR